MTHKNHMPRRTLTFRNRDDVLTDVAHLRTTGYTRFGNLDLAQVCTHLADTCEGYVHGFDISAPWWMRHLLAPFARRIVLTFNWIPPGIRVPDSFMPRPGGDVDAAIERLKRKLDEFNAHQGEYVPHPFLGRMSRPQYRKLNLLHCAHHLSFLTPHDVPATAGTAPASPPTARIGP